MCRATPKSEARTSLRTVLSQLRKVAGSYLAITRDSVGLNPRAPIGRMSPTSSANWIKR